MTKTTIAGSCAADVPPPPYCLEKLGQISRLPPPYTATDKIAAAIQRKAARKTSLKVSNFALPAIMTVGGAALIALSFLTVPHFALLSALAGGASLTVSGIGLGSYRLLANNKDNSCYLDLGIMYGRDVITNCTDWYPKVQFNQSKLDAYLDPIFAQLKKEGISRINLSFAQIANITRLLDGKPGSSTDTVATIFNPAPFGTKEIPLVGDTNMNFLQYLSQKAAGGNLKIDLAMGGAVATQEDMLIGSDPVLQAKNLAAFMNKYNIDSIDFDIEGAAVQALMNNGKETCVSFFTALHQELKKTNKRSTLTLAGDVTSLDNVLKPLFDKFNDMFDGVNLMLYSNAQYYLDADNPTWGIRQWIAKLPADKLSVGFYDSIAYEDPASSAGARYDVPTNLSRGQAAAWIYLKVLKDLKLTPDQFQSPFWWTDNPSTLATNTVIQDFYAYLENPPALELPAYSVKG